MTESEYWRNRADQDAEYHAERMAFLAEQKIRDVELVRVQTHTAEQRHYFDCESHSLLMKSLRNLDQDRENKKIAPAADRSP